MKRIIYTCDICNVEIVKFEKPEQIVKIQAIFTTEQNEGRTAEPYFELVNLELCTQCLTEALSGKAIFAEGAMGYNKYHFKTEKVT